MSEKSWFTGLIDSVAYGVNTLSDSAGKALTVVGGTNASGNTPALGSTGLQTSQAPVSFKMDWRPVAIAAGAALVIGIVVFKK